MNVIRGSEWLPRRKRTATSVAIFVSLCFVFFIIVVCFRKHYHEATTLPDDTTLNRLTPQQLLDLDDTQCGVVSKNHDAECESSAPPYLYVTFHGGKNKDRIRNVCKYSRTGCSLGAVLQPSASFAPRSLRGMLLIDDSLVVAEAHRDSSKIVTYGACDDSHVGRRNMTRIMVSLSNENPGLVHPYGLTAAIRNDKTYLIVSVQDRAEVLRYGMFDALPVRPPVWLEKRNQPIDSIGPNMSNTITNQNRGVPAPPPTRSTSSKRPADAGAFILLPPQNRVRDIVYAEEGRLFIADEDQGVLEYDWNGTLRSTLPVPFPISVYFCTSRHSIWVSSKKDHSVIEIDVDSKKEKQRIRHKYLKHPTGIAGDSEGERLFVLSQATKKILEFSMSSGRFVRSLVNHLRDDAERLVLSPC